MKRWTIMAVVAALLVWATPVALADSHEGGGGAKWKWFGKLRMRPEYNDNLSDVSVSRDDVIFFTSYRANLGFSVDLDKDVKLVVDGQALGSWGEDQTPLRGTQSSESTSAKFNFFQAYAEAKRIFGEPFSLRAGRQPLVFGDEWLLGDLDFYGGTSWDGLRGDFHKENGELSLFWAKAAEVDSPELNGSIALSVTPDTSGDFDLYGIWYDREISDKHHIDGAWIYTLDHRDFDLDPSTIDTPFRDKRFTWTVRYSYNQDGEAGGFVNVNTAYQNGTGANSSGTDSVDINAYAAEVTGGYVWMRKDQPNKLYARLGHYSGDELGTETKNEAFNIIAMDFHGRYGLLDFWTGFFGFTPYLGGSPGFQALQIGFDVQIPDGVRIKGYAQRLRRDEQLSEGFRIRNLGQEYGVEASYKYGKNVKLALGLAQLFPGTAFSGESPLFGQSSVRRGYLNTVVKF